MTRATLEEAEVACRRLGQAIAIGMPEGWGFVLVLASHGEGGFSTYVSNIEREGAVAMVRETLGKMERQEEV